MRMLPDHPDLDHLRQQAKDLLAGLRETHPDASLATAQASLAEQYGFTGWTDLKAEADRRRAEPVAVAQPALTRAVADAYGLGQVTGPMRALGRPDEVGRRWLLETDQGRWAVVALDTWIPIVDAETEVALQSAAAGAGVPLPAPVRSRSGRIVESIGGHDWRVNHWLHSGPPLTAPVRSDATRRVGTILATIHQLALPVDRLSPWHATRLSGTSWSALTAAAAGASWAEALDAAIPRLSALASVGEGEPAGAPVLCHNALGPGNVHRGTNGQLVVVGWEHAGGQPPSWELADALMHWTIDPGGAVNVAGARAMVEGYRSVAGSLPPLGAEMFQGAVTSLVNYVDGQIFTALDATDDDQRRLADRSVAHLLTHLPTPAHLEQLLTIAQEVAYQAA